MLKRGLLEMGIGHGYKKKQVNVYRKISSDTM